MSQTLDNYQYDKKNVNNAKLREEEENICDKLKLWHSSNWGKQLILWQPKLLQPNGDKTVIVTN